MSRGRWLLAAGFALILSMLVASPAAAAQCTTNCVRFYADITITASTYPLDPVFPGSTHTYTIRVTNTGWRVGGISAPTPSPGPDSGPVYVGIVPASPYEVPISHTNDSGVPFRCQGYHSNGLACDASSLPSNTTSQFTVTFQVPPVPGDYTCDISAYAWNWTEYNVNNNAVTVAYRVGYLA